MSTESVARLVQIPWHCGHHNGCRDGWHMATYARDDHGLVISRYSDGNWEPCQLVPTDEDEAEGWVRYLQFVEGDGEDPLEVVPLPFTPARWRCRIRFHHGTIASIFVSPEKGEPWEIVDNAPLELRKALCRIAMGCHSAADFAAAARTNPLATVKREYSDRVLFVVKAGREAPMLPSDRRNYLKRSATCLLSGDLAEAG